MHYYATISKIFYYSCDKFKRISHRRYDKHRQEQITLLYNAIELSIKSLGHLKPLYEDFAIFMDDVNIKPEVNA